MSKLEIRDIPGDAEGDIGMETYVGDNGQRLISISEVTPNVSREVTLTAREAAQLYKWIGKALGHNDDLSESFCSNCGHSYAQHHKGPVSATYCRHCPCPKWEWTADKGI